MSNKFTLHYITSGKSLWNHFLSKITPLWRFFLTLIAVYAYDTRYMHITILKVGNIRVIRKNRVIYGYNVCYIHITSVYRHNTVEFKYFENIWIYACTSFALFTQGSHLFIPTTWLQIWQMEDHKKHWNRKKKRVLSTKFLAVFIIIICFYTLKKNNRMNNYFSYSS